MSSLAEMNLCASHGWTCFCLSYREDGRLYLGCLKCRMEEDAEERAILIDLSKSIRYNVV